jgi:hypothetical protein
MAPSGSPATCDFASEVSSARHSPSAAAPARSDGPEDASGTRPVTSRSTPCGVGSSTVAPSAAHTGRPETFGRGGVRGVRVPSGVNVTTVKRRPEGVSAASRATSAPPSGDHAAPKPAPGAAESCRMVPLASSRTHRPV